MYLFVGVRLNWYVHGVYPRVCLLALMQDADTPASLRMPKFVTIFAVESKWWDHNRRDVSTGIAVS